MDCVTVIGCKCHYLRMNGELKMRKILYTIGTDDDSFAPFLLIKMRDEDGTVTELFKEEFVIKDTKYTAEQQAKINQVNSLLSMNGSQPLTEEECDWMLDPNSFKAYMDAEIEEDKLQRLAGFKVEKKITYFDDVAHEDTK